MQISALAVDIGGAHLTVAEIVNNYFQRVFKDLPDDGAAQALAKDFLRTIDAHTAAQSDYVRAYEAFVEGMWGDARLPGEVAAEIDAFGGGPLSEREQYLLNLYTQQRSDYLMATGAGGEMGEFLEVLKKNTRRHEINLKKLTDEAGDALYYLTVILRRHGITLREVMEFNTDKLTMRLGTPSKHRFPALPPPTRLRYSDAS